MPIDQNYSKLMTKFPKMEQQKSLAPFNSMGIGGAADLFYTLQENSEIKPLFNAINEAKIPFFVLGGGSNTIFADAGFRGIVIHFANKKITIENEEIAAESGALLSQLIQFSLKNNFTGMENLMGLPGTIGGAVRGNAGAYGIELKDIFAKALLFDPKNPQKGIYEATNQQMDFSYRHSRIKVSHEVVLKVWLKLSPGTSKVAFESALDILKSRVSKQPKGKCSGSFFKNPSQIDPKLKAGYLLEQAGCKGLRCGDIAVSENHANWLMNLANGKQEDLLMLMHTMQQKVYDKFQIQLEPEVQLVDETSPF